MELDPSAGLGARELDADGRVLVVGVELRDRDDAVVELDPEDGLGHGADVADGLLGGLARVGEDVDLDRAAEPIADDPDGVDPAQAAELVLELAELGGDVSVSLGRQFVVRPLTRHGDPVTPRGPGAPARAQHTAIRPPCVGASRCRCYLWGLRGDAIRVKLCVPFVWRRE